MNVVIVEDEPLAAERLEQAIRGCAPESAIVARLGAVRDTVAWLREQSMPDLMFMDIRLSDGVSFEIFKTCTVSCPIVFTTAYDNYLMDAFAANGIEYLLKPVEMPSLSRAIDKYRQLKDHFLSNGSRAVGRLQESLATGVLRRRRRFVVRKGAEFVSVPLDHVAYFFSEHKLTFLVDYEGQRFLLDDSLAQVEEQVCSETFFRANRQYLVSVAAILRFRPAGRGQIEVEVVHSSNRSLTISQERAGEFRRWLNC